MNDAAKKKLMIGLAIAGAVLLVIAIFAFSGSGKMAPGYQDAVKQRQQGR